MKRWVLALAAALLSACGYVGPPMPPTLDIPVTINDFRAWESGDNIEFEFTLPDKTTENLPLTSVRSIELRIGENLSDSKLVGLPIAKPGPVTDQVPARIWIGKTVLLAVRATGPKGKPSEWSNPASLPVIQPLAQPSTPKPQNVASGVELTWTGTGPRYRIFRAEGDGQPQQLADTDGPPYLDDTTSFGTRYRYHVQAIAGDNQWSVVSEAGGNHSSGHVSAGGSRRFVRGPHSAVDRACLDAQHGSGFSRLQRLPFGRQRPVPEDRDFDRGPDVQ